MWCEFGSKKAAAFSNPDIHRENKFAPHLHPPSLRSYGGQVAGAEFNLC
jgi:hypothetical protein